MRLNKSKRGDAAWGPSQRPEGIGRLLGQIPEDGRGMAAKMRRLVDYLFVEPVFIGEQIAARVFPALDSIRKKNRPLFERNLRTVGEFIGQEERLEWVEPEAGIVGFPRTRSTLAGDALAGILLKRFSTSVVPGSFFEDARHFRFGVPADVLAKGLATIRSALNTV